MRGLTATDELDRILIDTSEWTYSSVECKIWIFIDGPEPVNNARDTCSDGRRSEDMIHERPIPLV